MSSLKERIDLLESDLKAVPLRISVYHCHSACNFDPLSQGIGVQN